MEKRKSKIVLFALNGSFSHTNLAVRCLRRPLENDGFEVIVKEYNLRDMRDGVLYSLYSERADIYGFSSYIWNITEMLNFAENLKKLLPNSKIIFGGHEVSFESERYNFPFIDCIIKGEGEDAILSVCRKIEEGKEIEKFMCGGLPNVMQDEGILYRDGDYNSSTMLYYESSRGCPFSCAFCLSSATDGVRAKSIENVKNDLFEFEKLSNDIKIIKFVDRTFNFDKQRAKDIWKMLQCDEFTKKYHFEICASLLDDESFEILKNFEKGKIQLEVGLQSTNSETLNAISRHTDYKKTIENAKKIKSFGNIHIHLDLIVGLPFEDYKSFRKSFDEAYSASNMLQVGFLKLLPGTKLKKDAEKYGIVYKSEPPYNVLKTNWLSFDEINRLSEIADIIDRYRETGGFDSCLEFITEKLDSPFDFYEGLYEFIKENDGRNIRKISQNDAYTLLYKYVEINYYDKSIEFSNLMHKDYEAHENRKLRI